MLQITVQKSIVPHGRQQGFEVEGFVADRQGTTRRRAQKQVNATFIFAKQLGDDRLLVAEVVIQIARRYPQVSGDVIGGHTALTLGIEQLQAALNDPFAGLDPGCHTAFNSLSAGHAGDVYKPAYLLLRIGTQG